VIIPLIYIGFSFLLASLYEKYKVRPAAKNVIITNHLAKLKKDPLIKEKISFSIYYLALPVANLPINETLFY
jgi:membrane-anchored glycerophosphoryl diester phosphodiesterase (GDPDase)